MEIKLELPEGNNYINNLAFVRALMIKYTIESLDISYEEKEQLKKEVLKTLKGT